MKALHTLRNLVSYLKVTSFSSKKFWILWNNFRDQTNNSELLFNFRLENKQMARALSSVYQTSGFQTIISFMYQHRRLDTYYHLFIKLLLIYVEWKDDLTFLEHVDGKKFAQEGVSISQFVIIVQHIAQN